MSLQLLKEEIESMTKYHQTEILRLLYESDAKEFLNENQNGTFINMTALSDKMINSLNSYCSYVKEQQKTLNAGEKEKQRIEKEFFKDLKDNTTQELVENEL